MKRIVAGLCFAAAVALLSGCLERRERIRIFEDGSVAFHVVWESSDFSDIDEGDAAPGQGGGWEVHRETGQNAQGQQQVRLVAEREVGPSVPLPSTYAPSGAERGVPLTFPTDLEIELRGEWTYYHFSRVYDARKWSQVGVYEEMLAEEAQKFGAVLESGQEPTLADRSAFARMIVEFTIRKYEGFARAAFLEVSPHASQTAWLNVRAGLEELRATMNYERLASLMALAESEDNAEFFEQLEREFDTEVMRRLELALADSAGMGVGSVSLFKRAFLREKEAFEVTQEIADDRFTIEVEMPGEIVGSNADSTLGNVATWQFGGEWLRDRKVEILVTSRVRS